jgi:hypothetical protein
LSSRFEVEVLTAFRAVFGISTDRISGSPMRKRIFIRGLVAQTTALATGRLFAAGGVRGSERSSPVILTVRGKVRGGTVDFDAGTLEKLGRATVRTRTQWLTTPAEWSGVPLASVLARVGATGETLRLRALNDYSVTVPMTDVDRFAPILALRLAGKTLSVRERGPLIVIYPFDSFPELNSQVFHDRVVWQLREIEVE